MNEDLNKELESRVRDLVEINRELEQCIDVIAHDMNGPLQTMSEFSKALLEDYSDKLPADGQDCLRYLNAGAQKLSAMTKGLLELSRTGRYALEMTAVDIAEMARSIVSDLKKVNPLPEREVLIPEVLTVHGDARLLRVLMISLLGNAWKFTGKAVDARVEVGLVSGQPELTIFVRDNGIGFNMANIDKVFAPFRRAHAGNEFEGTGMGVPIARQIVRRHGGRIWAEGEPDKGATFYFTLGKGISEEGM